MNTKHKAKPCSGEHTSDRRAGVFGCLGLGMSASERRAEFNKRETRMHQVNILEQQRLPGGYGVGNSRRSEGPKGWDDGRVYRVGKI